MLVTYLRVTTVINSDSLPVKGSAFSQERWLVQRVSKRSDERFHVRSRRTVQNDLDERRTHNDSVAKLRGLLGLGRCTDANTDVKGNVSHLTKLGDHSLALALIAGGSSHRHAGRGVDETLGNCRDLTHAARRRRGGDQKYRRHVAIITRRPPLFGLLQ